MDEEYRQQAREFMRQHPSLIQRILQEGLTLEEEQNADQAMKESLDSDCTSWMSNAIHHPTLGMIQNYATPKDKSVLINEVYDKITDHLKDCELCREHLIIFLQ